MRVHPWSQKGSSGSENFENKGKITHMAIDQIEPHSAQSDAYKNPSEMSYEKSMCDKITVQTKREDGHNIKPNQGLKPSQKRISPI